MRSRCNILKIPGPYLRGEAGRRLRDTDYIYCCRHVGLQQQHTYALVFWILPLYDRRLRLQLGRTSSTVPTNEQSRIRVNCASNEPPLFILASASWSLSCCVPCPCVAAPRSPSHPFAPSPPPARLERTSAIMAAGCGLRPGVPSLITASRRIFFLATPTQTLLQMELL